jgi:hypothetical protein
MELWLHNVGIGVKVMLLRALLPIKEGTFLNISLIVHR